jgi:hypothetical protein
MGVGGAMVGVGEMMLDVAILDPDYINVINDLNFAAGSDDYRGGVIEALRAMNSTGPHGLKDASNPEWQLVTRYLHEMNTVLSAQGRRGEVLPPRFVPGKEEGEEGKFEQEDTIHMTQYRYRVLERDQIDPHIYPATMPEWYNRLGRKEQKIWDVRFKLLEAAALKKEIRNGQPTEKIRNLKPEIKGKEILLLMGTPAKESVPAKEGMPGFKEAMSVFIQDLCEKENDDNGRVFLRLKEDANGVMIKKVGDWVQNVEALEEHVAQRVADLRVKKPEGTGTPITEEVRDAVATMWNFMYLGDPIEAWDKGRQVTPSDACSDKVRTMFRLKDKFLAKNGIFKVAGLAKGYPNGLPPNYPGMEEPFISWNMFKWVDAQLKINREEFTDRILNKDLIKILPERTAVSLTEQWIVKIRSGEKDEDGKDIYYDTSMALALLGEDQNDKQISVDQVVDLAEENDKNVLQTFKDMEEGANMIQDLIKGDVSLASVGKDYDTVMKSFVQSTGLTRQEPNIPVKGKTNKDDFAWLEFVDDPMFYWTVALNSVGFDWTDQFPLLDIKKLAYNDRTANENNYPEAVIDLVEDMTTKSPTVDKREIERLLGVRLPKRPRNGDNIFTNGRAYKDIARENYKYKRKNAKFLGE